MDEVIWDATIEAAIHDPSTGEDSRANQFRGRTSNSAKLNTERNPHLQDIGEHTKPQSTQAERTVAKLRKYIGQTATSEGNWRFLSFRSGWNSDQVGDNGRAGTTIFAHPWLIELDAAIGADSARLELPSQGPQNRLRTIEIDWISVAPGR